MGGAITHDLGVIRAVGAQLTDAQLKALQSSRAVRRVYENRLTATAAKKVNASNTDASTDDLGVEADAETSHSLLVGADRLHAEGITGQGVTLAVLDSGLSRLI